jgi:hypothetical protein
MRKFFAACVVPVSILTACANKPTLPSLETKHPLDQVEVNYPVTFEYNGRRLGKVFSPPKTIDCSGLTLESDSFEDAIEAGALILRIQTQRHVKLRMKDENGNETTKIVDIQPTYGGVLALCNVSERAKGPDSRSYNIRDLDDVLIMGKGGLVSVAGGELKYGSHTLSSKFDEIIGSKINKLGGQFGASNLFTRGSGDYSWMLWLTDRSTTFTNYEAEVARRERKAKADKWKREREAKAAEAKAKAASR